jgi:hypothetical protein
MTRISPAQGSKRKIILMTASNLLAKSHSCFPGDARHWTSPRRCLGSQKGSGWVLYHWRGDHLGEPFFGSQWC